MEKQKAPRKNENLIVLAIFAVAMGLLEAAVVVYLRQIFYPEGMSTTMIAAHQKILSIEALRELATIVMLVTVSLVAGKGFVQRFAYFLYIFGIWDIFYYVFLKVFLGWPSSLLTWDVLFFVPVPWVSPVLAPIICSLTMIMFGAITVRLETQGITVNINLWDWLLMIAGAFVIFYSFIESYLLLIKRSGLPISAWASTNDPYLQHLFSQYAPAHYNWYLFLAGEVLILLGMTLTFRRANSCN
ncbi:hypothetical protein [Coprothermobacter platensis]|uniref:hypothetical protein n=1 Tax=Coprothermobacter platensis TaxID=108819 RepID=UPI00036BEAE6|nr:hypothetical protein [Coprothermobacter platensis]